MSEALPLFPLGALLFPAGRMSLQVFEPRYMDMIKRCLREGTEFGVVGIKTGSEVAKPGLGPPEMFDLGVCANIVDWHGMEHGRIGVVVEGRRRFKLRATDVKADFLITSEVEFMPEQEDVLLPPAYADLSDLLKQLAQHPSAADLAENFNYESASGVAYSLAQLLPIPIDEKYQLLCADSPLDVLAKIRLITDRLSGRAP